MKINIRKIFNLTIKTLVILSLLLSVSYTHPKDTFAQKGCSKSEVGICIDGKTCTCALGTNGEVCYLDSNTACGGGMGSEVIGKVVAPESILKMTFKGGLVGFFSIIVHLIGIFSGLISIINVVWAGFIYVTTAGSSSDSAELVKEKLTYSFMGMAIIVFSYTIAGLIGLVFFGDANFILKPTVEGLSYIKQVNPYIV